MQINWTSCDLWFFWITYFSLEGNCKSGQNYKFDMNIITKCMITIPLSFQLAFINQMRHSGMYLVYLTEIWIKSNSLIMIKIMFNRNKSIQNKGRAPHHADMPWWHHGRYGNTTHAGVFRVWLPLWDTNLFSFLTFFFPVFII